MIKKIKKGVQQIAYIAGVGAVSAVIAFAESYLSTHGISPCGIIKESTAFLTGTSLAIGAHLVHPDKWGIV